MNLRNFKIGTRLGLGFALILVGLIAVILFVNALSGNNRKAMADGLNLSAQKQVLANNMKSALFEGGIAMRNIGIQSDVGEMQKEEAKVKLQKKKYEEAKDKIASLGLSEEEKKILGDIAKIDKEIDKPLKDAVGQALAFNAEGAAKIIATVIDPLSTKSIQEMNKLVDVQDVASKQVFETFAAAGAKLTNWLYVILLSALALGALFAWTITRSITQPLQEALSLAETVAEGDLRSQVAVTGNDEVASLFQALKNMNDNLAATVGQVRTGTETITVASQEIASGNADLSSRTDRRPVHWKKPPARWKS